MKKGGCILPFLHVICNKSVNFLPSIISCAVAVIEEKRQSQSLLSEIRGFVLNSEHVFNHFFSSKGFFSNTVSWTCVANCLIWLKVKKIFCSMGKLCINRDNPFVPLLFSTQISVCKNEKMNKTVCLNYCLVGFYQASGFLFKPARLLGPFRIAANHKHTFHHWVMHLFFTARDTLCIHVDITRWAW